MASALAKSIRASKETDEYDLAGFGQSAVDELIMAAFKEPVELDNMIRVTFLVGAGKGGRSKYNDDLVKWTTAALKNLAEYTDDRGASCAMECAKSFKFQHDTGKNLLKIHVFPSVVPPKEDEDGEGGYEGEDQAPQVQMTPEWLCAAASAETFERMVDAKMPGWLHRKRCGQTLREFKEKLSAIEGKMVAMQTLEPEEQSMYDQMTKEDIDEKLAILSERMKALVEAGRLTEEEIAVLTEQIESKLETINETLADPDLPAKRKEKMENVVAALTERKAKMAAIKPIANVELKNQKELTQLWKRLVPLFRIMDKAGPMGKWSQKLNDNEIAALDGKDDIDAQIEEYIELSRPWYESTAEYNSRVAQLQRQSQKGVPGNKKFGGGGGGGGGGASAAPKKKVVNTGWSTVSSKPKAAPKKPPPAKKKAAGSGFAALMGDSDSD